MSSWTAPLAKPRRSIHENVVVCARMCVRVWCMFAHMRVRVHVRACVHICAMRPTCPLSIRYIGSKVPYTGIVSLETGTETKELCFGAACMPYFYMATSEELQGTPQHTALDDHYCLQGTMFHQHFGFWDDDSQQSTWNQLPSFLFWLLFSDCFPSSSQIVKPFTFRKVRFSQAPGASGTFWLWTDRALLTYFGVQ